MTAEPLTYDHAPRRRKWSAKWLVALGLLTAVGAGWRWWPVLWGRVNLAAAQYVLVRSKFPQAALAFDHAGNTRLQAPAEWAKFHLEYEGSADSNITLFLGERASPDGSRRFIQVGWPRGWQNPGGGILYWRSFDFPGWFTRPSELSGDYVGFAVRDRDPSVGLWGYSPVDVFTAVSDAVDTSHFSIRYRMNGRDNVVDGYLMNDGTVRFERRRSN